MIPKDLVVCEGGTHRTSDVLLFTGSDRQTSDVPTY